MNYHADAAFWNPFLQKGLEEDQFLWDWTARSVLKTSRSKPGATVGRLVAKSNGIWVGTGILQAIEIHAKNRGVTLQTRSGKKDGERFKKGDVLAIIQGRSDLVLTYERTFINLSAFASGIATTTARLVEIADRQAKKLKLPASPRITGTRKTLPHYRDLCVYSILCGGGFPHRISLASGVLIKENHIRACGGITRAIESARSVAPHGLKIETEVTSIRELKEAYQAGADIILLDNFSPDEVLRGTKWILSQNPGFRPLIEVSGGLNESNLSDYVLEGVDILSVGGLTHSVKSCDFSLLFRKNTK